MAIKKILFAVTSVLSLAIHLDAVSVSTALCPTNKIAPHRREASWEAGRPRTLGLLYSFLAPSQNRPRPPQHDDLDELQEQPQEDDPDDCGEIEDYDETDLSSITPGASNKVYDGGEHRFLFSDDYTIPSYYPTQSKPRPPRPQRPPRPPKRPSTSHRPQKPTYPPTRPPFHSGGIFGSNVYRPQSHHYPSSHIKPVQEYTYDYPQDAFRPGLVGGTLSHVVGFPLVRPNNLYENVEASAKKPSSSFRFPDSDQYKRRPRAKPPNVASSIFGTFVNLLLN